MPFGIAVVNPFLSRIAVFVLICLMSCLASADQSIGDAVTEAATKNHISSEYAAFFASRLAEIQASPKAVVLEAALSPWRRRELLSAIAEWGREFPPVEEQSDAVIRGHTSKYLLAIAQLFVVPPRTTAADSSEIKRQLARFNGILTETIRPRLITALSACTRADDPGEESYLSQDDIEALVSEAIAQTVASCSALSEGDDLSPYGRYAIPPQKLPDVEARVRAAALHSSLAIECPPRMFRFEDWQSAKATPHADSFVDAAKTSLLMDICRSLRGNGSAGAILEKAYADAVPISVTLELMRYRWTLDSLVDTKAIEQGWNERNAISFANMERKAEERRREFVGMVASLPQNQPPSQPEGLPIDRPDGRRTIFILVNAGLVGVIIIAMAIRQYWRASR